MSMDMLGPSLGDLMFFCGNKLSLKTTVMIGYQILERLEFLHEKSFIHRDIKPDNFLVGIHEQSHVVYCVDMGLAKRFIDQETQQHIPHQDGKTLTGTASYASIHAHQGEELSRRDDLESLSNLIIYFYKGVLLWQNLNCASKSEKYRKIKEMKQSTSIEVLTQNCPPEFGKFLQYCRNLRFVQKPDYNYLKELFQDIADRENFEIHDKLYDWSIKAITLQCFPTFFDFKKHNTSAIFNNQGKFAHIDKNNAMQVKISEKIYKMAKLFKFRSNPKQLIKLISQSSKNKNQIKSQVKALEIELQIAELHDQKKQLL
jgi:serine/threonine protein kinase